MTGKNKRNNEKFVMKLLQILNVCLKLANFFSFELSTLDHVVWCENCTLGQIFMWKKIVELTVSYAEKLNFILQKPCNFWSYHHNTILLLYILLIVQLIMKIIVTNQPTDITTYRAADWHYYLKSYYCTWDIVINNYILR